MLVSHRCDGHGQVGRGDRVGPSDRRRDRIAGFDGAYRGLDIGTAKPSASARRSVPHHLIDVLEPDEEFSLAQYVEAASHCAAEIAGRGREVLFVGGTPLYLKGLLRGILRGAAGRLGTPPPTGRPDAAKRQPVASSAGGPRGSGCRRAAAPERHPAAHPCVGGL